MSDTGNYRALHKLSPSQVQAVTALASGATHAAAAEAAGVHRVSVSRWVAHHPEFIAELNRLRADIATKAAARVARVTNLALDAIEKTFHDGDVETAFRWLRIVPPTAITSRPPGPTESVAVVEHVRKAMLSPVDEILASGGERTLAEAEQLIARRLSGP